MRKHYEKQRRFDCTPIAELMLNYDCRDEMVPVLAGLQHVYTSSALRNKVVSLVAQDINEESRRDVGRPGLDDWQIVVLAGVRLGCNFDFDKLQDQAENHGALRTMLGVGQWVEEPGWRQSKHLLKRVKAHTRTIAQISGSKSPKVLEGLPLAYERLLDRVAMILDRAKTLQEQGETEGRSMESWTLSKELQHWIELTQQVCDTAYRRVILNEKVPNCDKLFSLFETHTQLYRRGKAGTPNQFGRLVLVFEDGAGFISHYHLMDREALDADLIVDQTREAQKKHQGAIKTASFDRGFYSSENEEQLAEIVDEPCVAPRHPQQYAERLANGSVEFHRLRRRHPGIESAIGALQSGNGLKRCRDRSEIGFERYFGLAILGRNIHVLGKLLIARRQEQSAAAQSKRKAS
jgi:IS5 family transposase